MMISYSQREESCFQSCYIILLKMFNFQQQKRTWLIYMEKKQSLETIPEEALMSDLLGKDFKLVNLDMFKVLKGTMSEE